MGEAGAISCLSENVSEIAFVGEDALKKIVIRKNKKIKKIGAWKLTSTLSLGQIGVSPSRVYNATPLTLDSPSRAAILNALVTLNYQMCRIILDLDLEHILVVTIFLHTR